MQDSILWYEGLSRVGEQARLDGSACTAGYRYKKICGGTPQKNLLQFYDAICAYKVGLWIRYTLMLQTSGFARTEQLPKPEKAVPSIALSHTSDHDFSLN